MIALEMIRVCVIMSLAKQSGEELKQSEKVFRHLPYDCSEQCQVLFAKQDE